MQILKLHRTLNDECQWTSESTGRMFEQFKFPFGESRDMSCCSLSGDGQIEAVNCIQSPLGGSSKYFWGNPPHCTDEPHVTSHCRPHQKRGVCTIQRPWPIAVISVNLLQLDDDTSCPQIFTTDVHLMYTPSVQVSIGDVCPHWHVNARLDANTFYWTTSQCGLRGGT